MHILKSDEFLSLDTYIFVFISFFVFYLDLKD